MTEPLPADYRVRLPAFEGPLYLLLHLIRVNEMNVFDIPIVEITTQYQEYLDLMRALDLEIAGEFLVMAATLIHIKSRMLLPRDPEPAGEASEDPRAELTRQLIEYQRIKQAAEKLQALESVRGLVWNRPDRVFEEFEGEEMLVVDLYAILGAMKSVLGRLAARERLALRAEEYSVQEKVEWISALLAPGSPVSFLGLIAPMKARGEIIATFLALLELARQRRIVALQRAAFDDILLASAAPAQASS